MSRLLCVSLLFCTSLFAAEIPISDWKISPVYPLLPVAFVDSTPKTADLLDQIKMDWSAFDASNWQGSKQSELQFHTDADRAYSLAATYVTADGYTKATLEVCGSRPLVIYANGKELAKATSADSGVYTASHELTLDRTRMELVIATTTQASDSGAWKFSATIKQDSSATLALTTGTSLPFRPAHFERESELEDMGNLRLSHDGKYLLFKRTVREGDENNSVSWFEIWDVDQNKPYHIFGREGGPSNPKFSRDGKSLYYLLGKDEGSEIWSFSISTRTAERLQSAVKNLDDYQVTPDGNSIIYSVSKDKPENKTGYDLFRELNDRRTDYNNRRELYLSDLGTGISRPLTTTGKFEVEKWSMSPSGKQVLLIKVIDKHGRPYKTDEYWTLSLVTGESRKVFSRSNIRNTENICWINENLIAYSTGSHDASQEDTVYHNAAQLVAFTLDLLTGEHRNLTGEQEFGLNDEDSHSRIFYNPRDKKLYFHVALGGHSQFANSTVDGNSIVYRPFQSSFDFTDLPTFAANGSRVAYIAADYNSPKALFVYDFATNRERKLFDPNSEVVADWQLGSMEEWNFTNRLGIEIDGWIYKPADFSPDKKWPLIVYYYAGVSPRDVRFSYQYHMWTANGYVVYVLNPVGAFGRGQKFADYHAGDWGTEATQDVIEGTEKVLAAHAYLDKNNMGAYGGSYGGFITLDLVTKTNMFKTVVDMYGISNLTNYFGGGVWGYWYSDLASPGQFPWSDKDVYVDKSPIYSADKIKTPMLILHGGADNNVPWLESDQMFVALKLLGQEVVYARYQGETHNINTQYKNLIEHRQMMLEWFDKYLKNQPAAWQVRMEAYGK
jgi:dipeptidyl aminopeptidase/acylaminoacyl peptidase